MDLLAKLVDAGKLGGWVRGGVASLLAAVIAQNPWLAEYLSQEAQLALAAVAASIVVGVWSHFVKSGASVDINKFTPVLCALAITGLLAGCSVTLPNPFGGPKLTLTGDLGADMPGIEAYAASIKAGVQASAAKVKATFDKLCPYVVSAQQSIASNPGLVQSAASTVTGSDDNGAKMLNNINQGLALGGSVCAAAQAPSGTALVKTVEAVKAAENLIKTGDVAGVSP